MRGETSRTGRGARASSATPITSRAANTTVATCSPATDGSTLATSTPLWSPDKSRMVFTTAVIQQTDENAEPVSLDEIPWDLSPDGRRFPPLPIRYTCWLSEAAPDGQVAEPVALFKANCMHSGYVAANLAVRWHPSGQRLVFIGQTETGHHGVFEYEIQSGETRRIFPHTATHMVVDFSPDGNYLVCLASVNAEPPSRQGIWVSETDGMHWWRVPHTAISREQNGLSSIEQLRAARPVWSKNGRQFALVVAATPALAGAERQFALYVGGAESRDVRPLIAGTDKLAQVHWAPDGERLALVNGEDFPALRFVDLDGKQSPPVTDRPVRSFAGWNTAGNRLAYVVPESLSREVGNDYWALLFFPQPLARDAVYVAPGDGSATGDAVFSGMRVTFPHWSPTDEKLSLWFTFTPTYRSALSEYLRWGLQQGDPAAIFDVNTGEIDWLIVNPQERAQVGHYHLLRKNYDEALNYYEQAAAELPAAAPEAEESLLPFVDQRNFAFFHYYCLQKLGRDEEAAAKLAEFERTFLPLPALLPEDATAEQRQRAGELNRILDSQTAIPYLLRHLYVAEVFLSLDAAADAEQFFHSALETAPHEHAKLAAAIVLSQMLLVQQKNAEYADFATTTLAPLVSRTFLFDAYKTGIDHQAILQLPEHLSIAALLPMFSSAFIAGLPREQIEKLVPPWETLREQADHDTARLGCDLFLREAYRRLNREADHTRVERDITANPQREKLLPEEGVESLVRGFREHLAEVEL